MVSSCVPGSGGRQDADKVLIRVIADLPLRLVLREEPLNTALDGNVSEAPSWQFPVLCSSQTES